MQFRVTYDKNVQVLGEVVPKCDWGKLNNDTIKYVEFKLGKYVYTFGGFSEYNIKFEYSKIVTQRISKIFVFARGEKESFVLSCEYTEDGIEVSELVTEKGYEYGSIKVEDWRNGEVDEPYVVKCDVTTKKIKGVYQFNSKCEG